MTERSGSAARRRGDDHDLVAASRPSSARPTGEADEIRPAAASDSDVPDDRQSILLAVGLDAHRPTRARSARRRPAPRR